MSAVNRAAVLVKVHDLRLMPVPMPAAPGPGQVTVQILQLGICGSDCHCMAGRPNGPALNQPGPDALTPMPHSDLNHGAIGPFVVRDPMIIGHECAGVVTALGPGIESLVVGDRVALEPGLPCRRCSLCLSGQYNLCARMRFFATPPVDGALALFLNHDADFCHRLPDALSLEQGALCEPLSVGVYACERAGLRPGQAVAVLGAGPIGLISMLTARAFGARYVAITDVSEVGLGGYALPRRHFRRSRGNHVRLRFRIPCRRNASSLPRSWAPMPS